MADGDIFYPCLVCCDKLWSSAKNVSLNTARFREPCLDDLDISFIESVEAERKDADGEMFGRVRGFKESDVAGHQAVLGVALLRFTGLLHSDLDVVEPEVRYMCLSSILATVASIISMTSQVFTLN